MKVSTYISKAISNDGQIRFAIKNYYGSIKVWGIGTLTRNQEAGTLVQFDVGVSQVDALLYAGFPLLAFPLLYKNAYPLFHNFIVIGIAFTVVYGTILFAIILGENSLQEVATTILS